ncbi:hypothetical protein P152DRAFT_456801 [Eremomyces bilateralis CBS 781.70]|uniref:KOW domain-containing protein n=1 Tax=Eremomyces bilateralis CBS 781.70 TaxID=1392243 RepID=A0A6G1G9F2_9PEZI|nr:uncharacterized protein P152DRAFT_456801 [Eremomyces bilateralis CBS 781.70]KAF1814531.1 hypothetical protein P152DRAFT_456801 [Eremomyces bilateralis CBS 781.70]
MDKVVARTKYVIRYAKRRNAQKAAKEDYVKLKERFNNSNELRVRLNEVLRAAKHAQREDWRLGPLAPRRDVGEGRTKYGYLDAFLAHGVPFSYHGGDRAIRGGDRVVVLAGRDKGKIGKATDVNHKNRTCKVAGLNQFQYYSPEWHQKATGLPNPVATAELPLRLDDVRLVCKHPETGRDVIVERLEERRVWREKHNKHQTRWFIPGCETPYRAEGMGAPKATPSRPTDRDTPDELADEETFQPQLKYMPMPASVIDELRGKYSKFRTRHDREWVEQKKRAAAEEQRKVDLAARSGLSPLQEYHLMMKQRKVAKDPPALSEEMWARIAQVMAAPKEKKATVVQSLIAAQDTSSVQDVQTQS